jgi:5-hydroxyisourate hydrolase-like protein (transthyretin family)
MSGPSTWTLLHATILAPRILKWRLRFLENLCTPAIYDLLPTVNLQIVMIIRNQPKSDQFQNGIKYSLNKLDFKKLAIYNTTCIHLATKLFKIVVIRTFLGLHIDNADYSVPQTLSRGQSHVTIDTFKLLYCTFWNFLQHDFTWAECLATVPNATQLFEIMIQNRSELLYFTANNIQLVITTLQYLTSHKFYIVEITNNMHWFVPLLCSIYWLLHVSTVACHHQGAFWIFLSYLKCKSNGWYII